eukprot:10847911-Alexandrium_andersonii.AAC.1
MHAKAWGTWREDRANWRRVATGIETGGEISRCVDGAMDSPDPLCTAGRLPTSNVSWSMRSAVKLVSSTTLSVDEARAVSQGVLLVLVVSRWRF